VSSCPPWLSFWYFTILSGNVLPSRLCSSSGAHGDHCHDLYAWSIHPPPTGYPLWYPLYAQMKSILSLTLLSLVGATTVHAQPVGYPIAGTLECRVNDGTKKYPSSARYFNGQYHFTINGHERTFRRDRHGHPTWWIQNGSPTVWSFIRGNTTMEFYTIPSRNKRATVIYSCTKS